MQVEAFHNAFKQRLDTRTREIMDIFHYTLYFKRKKNHFKTVTEKKLFYVFVTITIQRQPSDQKLSLKFWIGPIVHVHVCRVLIQDFLQKEGQKFYSENEWTVSISLVFGVTFCICSLPQMLFDHLPCRLKIGILDKIYFPFIAFLLHQKKHFSFYIHHF